MRSASLLRLVVLLAALAAASCRRRNRPGGSSASSSGQDAVDVGEPAMLTPLLQAGKFREAQNMSRVDPPLLGELESYSGFLTVDAARNANLFFWFFPAEGGKGESKALEDANVPLVLWLQGGPGSSAMLGIFLEHGPVKLRKGRRLKRRRHAWTRAAHMLYVDSPVGAGFSFADDPAALATSSEQAGRDLLVALRQFYQLFPQLRDAEFFIAGESYAGKFAPALAMAIHAENQLTTADGNPAGPAARVNLKGIALGNPLADPESMLGYGDYLYQLGLVDEHGRDLFREREDVIRSLIQQRRWTDAARERNALIGRSSSSSGGVVGDHGDHHDERDNATQTLFNELTGYRYRFNYLHDTDYLSRGYKQFVQRPSVRALLHVGNATFHNRTTVAESMRGDVMQSARPLYEQLLEHYDVLLYNGQLDVADPYPMMVNFLRRLQWSGADAYRDAPRRLWTVDGELAGYVKTAGRLTEVLVRAAGHMVPADQPKWALDLITKFVAHKPIA